MDHFVSALLKLSSLIVRGCSVHCLCISSNKQSEKKGNNSQALMRPEKGLTRRHAVRHDTTQHRNGIYMNVLLVFCPVIGQKATYEETASFESELPLFLFYISNRVHFSLIAVRRVWEQTSRGEKPLGRNMSRKKGNGCCVFLLFLISNPSICVRSRTTVFGCTSGRLEAKNACRTEEPRFNVSRICSAV